MDSLHNLVSTAQAFTMALYAMMWLFWPFAVATMAAALWFQFRYAFRLRAVSRRQSALVVSLAVFQLHCPVLVAFLCWASGLHLHGDGLLDPSPAEEIFVPFGLFLASSAFLVNWVLILRTRRQKRAGQRLKDIAVHPTECSA